jgi:hypothetical protein
VVRVFDRNVHSISAIEFHAFALLEACVSNGIPLMRVLNSIPLMRVLNSIPLRRVLNSIPLRRVLSYQPTLQIPSKH